MSGGFFCCVWKEKLVAKEVEKERVRVKRGECREGKEKARGNLVCIGRGEFDRILLAKYLDRHIIPSLNI